MKTEKIKIYDDLTIEVFVNSEFGMLIKNEEAATGFGITPKTLRNHKQQKPDQLIENKHWIMLEISTGDGMRGSILWTLRGILRLQLFVQTVQAIKFGSWAEEAIFERISVEITGRKDLLIEEAKLKNKIKVKKEYVDSIDVVIELNKLQKQLNDLVAKKRGMDTRYVNYVLATWDEAVKNS